MKKIGFLSVLLIALSVLGCSSHEHIYDDVWNKDENYHWHDAICCKGIIDNKIPHEFDSVVTNPTYEQDGYTTHTCTTCGYSFKDTYTNKLEHTYSSSWSYNESTHWHACIDRGFEHLKKDEASHSFKSVVTNPTYEQGGYTTHTCTTCGYSYVNNNTNRLTYKITWKNWDGTTLRVDKCYKSQIPSYGSNPTRESDEQYSYSFSGWSPTIEAAYSDATYTAQFTQHERTSFIVQYNSNGGDVTPSNQTKTKGQTLTLTSTKPTKKGYIFVGWNNIFETTIYSSGSSFTLDRDVTLWAM